MLSLISLSIVREGRNRKKKLAMAETYNNLPPVLDACCGSRAFWFDKKDRRALFVDIRRETIEQPRADGPRSPVVVDPDELADFTRLPFADGSFSLVVFDPPHLIRKPTGNVLAYYGALTGDWRETLRQGFAECFRVLKPDGTLIFKWAETAIPISQVLRLTPERPLFGHKSGKLNRTHWVAFIKDSPAHGSPRG